MMSESDSAIRFRYIKTQEQDMRDALNGFRRISPNCVISVTKEYAKEQVMLFCLAMDYKEKKVNKT